MPESLYLKLSMLLIFQHPYDFVAFQQHNKES